MKSTLLLVAAAAAGLSSAALAVPEMKEASGKAAAPRSAPAEIARPHYRPTGKPASAARGEAVFLDHCAICHGLHGKGDGPRSAFFQPGVQYIPDLTAAAFLKGRDPELMNSIREGLRRLPEPAYVMPQFKYILSDEEIRSVLAYVKTLPATLRK